MPSEQAGSVHAAEAATRVSVDVRRIPWIRKLAADYVFDFPAVSPFFSGDPASEHAWADTIRRAQKHPRQRDQLVSVLEAQQRRRGAPSQAVHARGQLARPDTVAVLTGQQAGLFGGPLYTLLKAITALKLAERLSRDHHVDVVTVFWVEAEDHDWDEVRWCTVFDEALAPHRVELPAFKSDDLPVARVRLDESVAGALDQIEQFLAPTEFRGALLDGLRRIYTPGAGMADAFATWLESVLGDRGLIVYDASDPASKPLASSVFARELSSPGETVKEAARAGSGLTARGYHAQVQAAHDGVALFRLEPERRIIRQQNGHFVIGDQRVQPAALVQEARTRPDAFSPNVLLRPIVQDTLFPTVSYVAGPSELAYLGQLRGVYERFGLPMPIMYPRVMATLVDSAALRFLQKNQVALASLQPQDEAALNDLLRAQIPPGVEASLAAALEAVNASMARVIAEIPAIDPTLEGAAKSTRDRMQHDLSTLQNKMIQAAKRRDETLRRQYLRTRALAFPNGHPQEREIGFVSFLNQYGPALVTRLFDELPLDLGHHWIVSI